MPKLDLSAATRIKLSTGEVEKLKGNGFSWEKPAGGPVDIWDPVNLPIDHTISGSVVTCGAFADEQFFVVGANPLVGKVYWELENVSGNAINTYPGVVEGTYRSNAATGNASTDHWRDGGGWHNTGRWLSGNNGSPAASNNFNFPAWVGDENAGILMFAWDDTTKELWVGQNGDWYANDDSVVGGPGVTSANVVFSTLDVGYPAVRCRQTGTAWGLADRSSALTYTIPTGFSTITGI